MPTIYDNIENNLLEGLLQMMQNAVRADFCVGYFNLRGWDKIADSVDELQGEDDNYCRLLIGMMHSPEDSIRALYEGNRRITQELVKENMQKTVERFAKQLTFGYPTDTDGPNLKNLAKQLRNKKLRVKFHGRHLLHAKLYLIHRQDNVVPLAGVVGSSNLTFAGLQKNGELNVDVLDQDSAIKLSNWFNERWEDDWSIDISDQLADVIEQSWVCEEFPPYHIYLKTAYELSHDAIDGVNEYMLPPEFADKMLDFQAQAVFIAAKILHQQNGVIIGDVVGLGKTITASAVAKVFQEDKGDNVLVICPPRLMKMWEDYLHNYKISGKVFSSGTMNRLADERHYKLIVVDESHNFRNRDATRYGHLHDYIAEHDSRVILLTATPYNKGFLDIASQLRLFISPEADLGIRPDNYIIDQCGGIEQFNAKHSKTLVSSLAAFEHSDNIDDWRELMRRYLVRRTRSHIIDNFAEKDKEDRAYLTFNNGEKFYFPARVPLRLDFANSEGDTDDDYAKLYSKGVADIIGELKLPRYGLGKDEYIKDYIKSNEEDERIINNLTRAGVRLRGFARSNLFKRLESGGDTFLLSIRRHINRNAAYIAALDEQGKIPIGQIYSDQTDEALAEAETECLLNDSLSGIEKWQAAGKALYKNLKSDSSHDWISSDYFTHQLREDLQHDIEKLLNIHRLVPQWQAGRDRKLHALFKLVQKTHGKDKILIFTQFTDTAEYLHRELEKLGVRKIALAHGGIKDIASIVNRFSPCSNDHRSGELDELRIVIATDVLSEGQNLQDAHIIVNYDLPWAIIRLIQRVGRVDRIGQKAKEIFCYSAMPETDIETVIDLRGRLSRRIHENQEIVGSDERFFEDEQEQQNLRDLYECKVSLEEKDNETDLLSRAFDIWQNAIKDNPELAKIIKKLPPIVYSAKKAKDASGVIAYVRDSNGNNILAHVNEQGEVVSQSQSHILDLLECKEDTPRATNVKNHHFLVRSAVRYLENNAIYLGGQLGGAKSVQHKLYVRLNKLSQNKKSMSLLSEAEVEELGKAVQQIYDSPLTEIARDKFRRLLQYTSDKQSDNMLQETTLNFYQQKKLCVVADSDNNQSTNIICSMGLIK